MTTETDTIDPGHLLTVHDWEQVVQEAEGLVRRAAMKLGASSFPSVNGFVPARWGGGSQTPRFGVLHDAETPLANGYAYSIARMFSTTATQKSAHFMVGPEAAYQLRDSNLLAWHCGNGNRYSIGVEQAGYAAFSRDQWLSAAGVSQMNRVAALIRDIKNAHGIGMYWMTDQQLLDSYNGRMVGGWATHHQCARVLKGTTHTDPDPNYPYTQLMNTANGGSTPAPAPQPVPPSGSPARLGWNLPRGHYYGNMNGGNAQHGGDPRYDSPAIQDFVGNIQAWLIYKGCVPGVTNWKTSGWDDKRWEAATDQAMVRWHARYYPGQPKPAQCWSDDYDRLARA